MKKRLFITISVMVAALVVAVVSCKKDNENSLLGNNNETSKSFDMRQIDDMGAYLKDFRHKMLESKDSETLSLEDAAWHLACLANSEHCNINVHFDNVRFDTLNIQVNVTDGGIQMNDLRTTYEQMEAAIQNFQDGLSLDNQNLRFINMFISGDGNAKIALMTTFNSVAKNLSDHQWYFPGYYAYVDSVCQQYFDSYTRYRWNVAAIQQLTTVINVFEGNQGSISHSAYYIPTRYFLFEYPLWIDTYGDTFCRDSRLFAIMGNFNYDLYASEMCYCLDSYLGLGCDWLANNYYVDNEYPLTWEVMSADSLFSGDKTRTYYHKLGVQYGQLVVVGPGPDPD